jgi:hypothetical protein
MKNGDPEGYIHSGAMAMKAVDMCVLCISPRNRQVLIQATYPRFGQLPPLFDLLWYLPATGSIKALENIAHKLIKVRQHQSSGSEHDIASHLVSATNHYRRCTLRQSS